MTAESDEVTGLPGANYVNNDHGIQLRTYQLEGNIFPCGLSFRNSELAHNRYEKVDDVSAPNLWIENKKFRIENPACVAGLLELFGEGKRIEIDNNTKQEQVKERMANCETKLEAQKKQKRTLAAYMCYALSTENGSGGPQYLPDGFCFSEDNNRPGHWTLHPQESRTCDCVSLSIGAKNYAYCEAITDLNWAVHCICLRAAAEPPALDLSDDEDGWKVACIIFSHVANFSGDDLDSVLDLLETMEQCHFRLDAMSVASIQRLRGTEWNDWWR